MLTKMREELTLTLVYLLGTITLMTASIVNKEFVAKLMLGISSISFLICCLLYFKMYLKTRKELKKAKKCKKIKNI